MKYLSLILALLLLATPVFADDGDIDKVEVKPDVVAYKLDTVKFLIFTQTCEVTYRKVDASDNPIGEEINVIFMNIADNPETTEVDETSNEFTQLVNAINNGSNIKTTITNAVKIKLQIN